MTKTVTIIAFSIALRFMSNVTSSVAFAEGIKKPFTIADEIELALFIPHMGIPNTRFSPDGSHFVYTAAELAVKKGHAEHQLPAIVGTGLSIFQLLLPEDPTTVGMIPPPSHLWAVIGGRRFAVKNNGAPIIPEAYLSLSPDGNSLVTILPVFEVP